MDERGAPRVARFKAYYTELEQGRTYAWCRCGLSRSQPYCDGRHRGTDFKPVRYRADTRGEEVLFCGCKHTKTPPFCDGSHNNLLSDYPEDDPGSEANRRVPEVTPAEDARSVLNGGCYVFSTDRARKARRGALRYCTVIGPEHGSIHQSQFHFETGSGDPTVIAFGERDVVLFMTEGDAEVTISGRTFAAQTRSGVYVAPGEAFSVAGRNGGATVRFLASACPRAAGPEWPDRMPDNFDATKPERVVPLDPAQRQGMASRYFQMLVDGSVGSKVVTQFIGHIPLSKAEPHRHLYEEALIILTGAGCMWTENLKARVGAGDVVFLPRKQLHSLEATSPEGMLVVGTIYPGDNPAINY